MTQSCLTLGYVPGGTPAKWARIWAQRHPDAPLQLQAVAAADAADAVRGGTVDLALLRLPADTSGARGDPALRGGDGGRGAHRAPVERRRHDHRRRPCRRAPTVPARRRRRLGCRSRHRDRAPPRDHRGRDGTRRRGARRAHRAAVAGAAASPQGPHLPPDRRRTRLRGGAGLPGRAAARAGRGVRRGRAGPQAGLLARAAEPAPKRTAREKMLAKQAARAAAGKVARKPGPAKRGRR